MPQKGLCRRGRPIFPVIGFARRRVPKLVWVPVGNVVSLAGPGDYVVKAVPIPRFAGRFRVPTLVSIVRLLGPDEYVVARFTLGRKPFQDCDTPWAEPYSPAVPVLGVLMILGLVSPQIRRVLDDIADL